MVPPRFGGWAKDYGAHPRDTPMAPPRFGGWAPPRSKTLLPAWRLRKGITKKNVVINMMDVRGTTALHSIQQFLEVYFHLQKLL